MNIWLTIVLIFSLLFLLIKRRLAVLFILVSIGTFIFIVVGIQNASMEKLLKEGEYSEKEKNRNTIREVVGLAYWGIIGSIFIVWSFNADAFDISWVVFVIGGALFVMDVATTWYTNYNSGSDTWVTDSLTDTLIDGAIFAIGFILGWGWIASLGLARIKYPIEENTTWIDDLKK